MKYLPVLMAICWLPFFALAQSDTSKSISVPRISEKISIDGRLDEKAWASTPVISGFQLNYPQDSSLAAHQTEVRLMYDQEALYVAALCHTGGARQSVTSLKRDFPINTNDLFGLAIDPVGDKSNGFAFRLSPAAVQYEASISSASRESQVWDCKWYAATTRYDSLWVAELRIPFSSIRFDKDALTWSINFSRQNITSNETSSWPATPRNFQVGNLLFSNPLEWADGAPESNSKLAVIPYVSSDWSYREETGEHRLRAAGGGEVKLSVTPSLNLDLTANPDFSQAEADAQVINLQRFSIFFPERRNFFIENNDLFANFGFTRIRPFFSRRIGISEGQIIPIIAGARLSGKVDENWRVGLMNIQTERRSGLTKANNYTVAAVQRQVFKTSNLAAIFVNKQSAGPEARAEDFNRIIGLDYNLLSQNNRWMGKMFFHHSLGPTKAQTDYAHASWIRYNTLKWKVDWNHEYVGRHYTAETGFVPREGRGYWRLEPAVQYYIYTKKSALLNRHGPRMYYDLYTNASGEFTDELIQPSYYFDFQNTSQLRLNYSSRFTRLLAPFNPNTNDSLLFDVGGYHYRDISFAFNPARRKRLSIGSYAQYGEFFIGNRLTMGGSASLRLEPYVSLSVQVDQSFLNNPAPYQDANFTLISPKIDVSFNRNLFASSFIQLNSQADNVGVNARLQWRFKPLSDLFLVINQNIQQSNSLIKDSSVILKVNYWLNV